MTIPPGMPGNSKKLEFCHKDLDFRNRWIRQMPVRRFADRYVGLGDSSRIPRYTSIQRKPSVNIPTEGPIIRIGLGHQVACAEARPTHAFLPATPLVAVDRRFFFIYSRPGIGKTIRVDATAPPAHRRRAPEVDSACMSVKATASFSLWLQFRLQPYPVA